MTRDFFTFEIVQDIEFCNCIWAKQTILKSGKLKVRNTLDFSKEMTIRFDHKQDEVELNEFGIGKIAYSMKNFKFVIHNTEFACRINVNGVENLERILYITFKFEDIFEILTNPVIKKNLSEFDVMKEWLEFSEKTIEELVTEKQFVISEAFYELKKNNEKASCATIWLDNQERENEADKIMQEAPLIQQLAIDRGIRMKHQISFLQNNI